MNELDRATQRQPVPCRYANEARVQSDCHLLCNHQRMRLSLTQRDAEPHTAKGANQSSHLNMYMMPNSQMSQARFPPAPRRWRKWPPTGRTGADQFLSTVAANRPLRQQLTSVRVHLTCWHYRIPSPRSSFPITSNQLQLCCIFIYTLLYLLIGYFNISGLVSLAQLRLH